MPRTKLDTHGNAEHLVRGTIKKYSEISGKSVTDCAESWNISASALYGRIGRPDRLTISDMRHLSRSLGIPHGELFSALEGML